MSRGIAATRHLFPEHCADGARLIADLSYVESDLRNTARRLSRHPNDLRAQTNAGDLRAKRAARREDLRKHTAECAKCAVAEGAPS